MGLLQKEKNRNAAQARNSFVTRKIEGKLNVLADKFRETAGSSCTGVDKGTLSRTLHLQRFQYLKDLKLVYNWENRFLSVNYNLQMLSEIPVNDRFEETGTCGFELLFHMKGSEWVCRRWVNDDYHQKDAYLERLSNPLIMNRIRELDIVDLEITHEDGSGYFTISLESMIGSATWIFIPPITNLIIPKTEECVQFFELFELLGDAVANNRDDKAGGAG